MPSNESHDKQLRRAALMPRGAAALLTLALAAGTAVTTAGLSCPVARAGGTGPRGYGPVSPVGIHAPQGDELHVELSTAGFAPAEVTRAAGAFAIAVDNRDLTEEYVLQLKAEGGALLNEVRVQQGSAEWTVELAAGTYTLTVVGHPDWICQIVVQ